MKELNNCRLTRLLIGRLKYNIGGDPNIATLKEITAYVNRHGYKIELEPLRDRINKIVGIPHQWGTLRKVKRHLCAFYFIDNRKQKKVN